MNRHASFSRAWVFEAERLECTRSCQICQADKESKRREPSFWSAPRLQLCSIGIQLSFLNFRLAPTLVADLTRFVFCGSFEVTCDQPRQLFSNLLAHLVDRRGFLGRQ